MLDFALDGICQLTLAAAMDTSSMRKVPSKLGCVVPYLTLLIQLSGRFQVVPALAGLFKFILYPRINQSDVKIEVQAMCPVDQLPTDSVVDDLEEELQYSPRVL